MGESAVRVARAANYVGAGTVEFLVSDVTREFYFLEMNTRLQVEHPVTELVTGIDLVREQITVAAGHALSFTQDDIEWRGHAIECRVYAEDPDNNFLPSPGRINFLRVPAGPNVRDDGGVYAGAEVSIYYDPMISKLAAWGRTRGEAIERMRRALDEYTVGGIKTTLPFFREVVRDGEFIAGRLDTGFIEGFNRRRAATTAAVEQAARNEGTGETPAVENDAATVVTRDLAIITAALAAASQNAPAANDARGDKSEARVPSQWRVMGRVAQHRSRDLF
jgi:acetyl-CoA carboxylase biotin carboxylase subunit